MQHCLLLVLLQQSKTCRTGTCLAGGVLTGQVVCVRSLHVMKHAVLLMSALAPASAADTAQQFGCHPPTGGGGGVDEFPECRQAAIG